MKKMSYAESDNEGAEDDDEIFKPVLRAKNARPTKRRKVSESSDEDAYEDENVVDDSARCVPFQIIGAKRADDLDDFIVPDDSEDDVRPSTKRKRPSSNNSRKSSSTRRVVDEDEVYADELDLELPEASTAQQWTYDPENPQPLQPRSVNALLKKPDNVGSKYK